VCARVRACARVCTILLLLLHWNGQDKKKKDRYTFNCVAQRERNAFHGKSGYLSRYAESAYNKKTKESHARRDTYFHARHEIIL